MDKTAYCIIRDQPHYRSEAFAAGLRAAGYAVNLRPPGAFRAGDVLVCWNRYGYNHTLAGHAEAAGGTVLVAENGYLGADAQGHQFYAIARHGHNGSGHWKSGDASRWAALGVALKPWRASGRHILICGQRGIGSPSMASPAGWHEAAAARIAKLSKRPVRIRLHPGPHQAKVPLEEDLRDAWACVIWSSASGVRALVEGIPVCYDAPHWIGQGAARGIDAVETPMTDDAARLGALQRMAWAQWTVAEIASGEPFRRLLA